MAITASQVNDLRQKTGLGMMECKQALTEVNGDTEKAIDLLRKKGIAKMDSRADRTSSEGRVFAISTPDHSKAVAIEVNSETDFTAGNDAFKAMLQSVAAEALKLPAGAVEKSPAIQAKIDEIRLTTKENVQFARGTVLGGKPGHVTGTYVHFNGKIAGAVELKTDGVAVPDSLLVDICQHICAAVPPPISVDETGVPAELLAKEKEVAKAQAIESGKPEAIAEKMVTGKIRKFYEENTLIHQISVKHMEEKKRIKDLLPKGVSIASFARYALGGK